MPCGVARAVDDLETEHIVAVTDGLWGRGGGDLGDVGVTGVQGGTARLRHDLVDTAGMIGMLVGQDHVPDRVPGKPGLAERGLDGSGAPPDAGVDQCRLPAPVEDVGGDEIEVHSLEG